MKELMVAIKLSAWDDGTLFIITKHNAYPFCVFARFKDVAAPTISEIESVVAEFRDVDMRIYGGVGLTYERVIEARTVWSVKTTPQGVLDAENTVVQFTRETVDIKPYDHRQGSVEGVKDFKNETDANEHQERMTRQHGDKYNFFRN